MGKVGFVFSGQGSQYSGMGKELYDNFKVCKDVFDEADNALGFKLSEICFNEENATKLNDTLYSQPAIYTLSVSAFKLLESQGLLSELNAGLSLGEYSALTCSSVFKFEDGIKLVSKRGQIMSKAAATGNGTMAAIMGMNKKDLEKVCQDCADFGYVICANYNTGDQIVISGEVSGVEAAEKLAVERGAKRAIRLNVSGAFHSKLMNSAKDELAIELNKIEINDFSIPVVTNTTGEIIKDKESVINNLLIHMVSPVKWEDTILTMINNGVDTFIELGCGKTLVSFIKKINRDSNIYNLENLSTFKKIEENII